MTLRDALVRDEGGFQAFAYQDSRGFWTIGYGRCIDRRSGKGLARAEGELMLDNDIRGAEADVAHRIPWAAQLDEPRRAVLVMLAFNMGIGGLLTFRKMLAAMGKQDWPEAARELLDSDYAQQVGPRAQRLARQLESGEWI